MLPVQVGSTQKDFVRPGSCRGTCSVRRVVGTDESRRYGRQLVRRLLDLALLSKMPLIRLSDEGHTE
jgi:hypothetical protein